MVVVLCVSTHSCSQCLVRVHQFLHQRCGSPWVLRLATAQASTVQSAVARGPAVWQAGDGMIACVCKIMATRRNAIMLSGRSPQVRTALFIRRRHLYSRWHPGFFLGLGSASHSSCACVAVRAPWLRVFRSRLYLHLCRGRSAAIGIAFRCNFAPRCIRKVFSLHLCFVGCRMNRQMTQHRWWAS